MTQNGNDPRIRNVLYLILLVCLSIAACKKGAADPVPGDDTTNPPPPTDTVPSMTTLKTWLVDKAATDQTAALFYNLKKVAKTNIL
jgi:mannan endo-1,4-beta-mannosidase